MTDTARRQAEFEGLQRKLVPLWESIRAMTQDEQTIVVVPSITLDSEGLTGSMMQAYEERFLFLLLLLRQPRARLVYVTSQAIHPTIVDYYLDLLPGVIASHARARLFLPSPLDASPGPLSEKLLARPKLLERIRALIPDPDRVRGPVRARRPGPGAVEDAGRQARGPPGPGQAQRGGLGRGQRADRPRAAAAARGPDRGRRDRGAGPGDAVRDGGRDLRRVRGQARGPGRRGRGTDHGPGVPEPQRPAAGHAARRG